MQVSLAEAYTEATAGFGCDPPSQPHSRNNVVNSIQGRLRHIERFVSTSERIIWRQHGWNTGLATWNANTDRQVAINNTGLNKNMTSFGR